MIAANVHYSLSLSKVSAQKDSARYNISLFDRPIINLALEKRQKGGQGLGKNHKITKSCIDADNRVFGRVIARDASGQFYNYPAIGILHLLMEEAI